MSRLIFRNLPVTLTPAAFQAHITAPASLNGCTLTDTKLVAKRRFAFVGYKTPEDAAKVKEWFNGTYVGTTKITVEDVREDAAMAPPAKRARTDVATSSNATPSTSTSANPTKPTKPNKQLDEFMQVMKGADPVASASSNSGPARDQGWGAKGKAKELTPVPEPVAQPEEVAEEDEDDDAAWLRKRQEQASRQAELGEKEDVGATEVPERIVETVQQDTAGPVVADSSDPSLSADEALIMQTSRLFVRNLAFVTTAADLSSHFAQYGTIAECHLPVSSTTSQPLGTAFIMYTDSEAALAAYRALDKTAFQGRLLHVLPGRFKPGQEVVQRGLGEKTRVLGKDVLEKGAIKKGVEEKRKGEAGKGMNWATLYMNSDAVVASVADRMGISKAELLNGENGDAAVKLALAETHVIQETKKYFEEQGIQLDAFASHVPRSQTIILVKNIPYGTTINTLTDLFSPHGEIMRVLLPPAGTLGVVEYATPEECSRAFKALAYRRIGNSVIYLEKGPVGMFKETVEERAEGIKNRNQADALRAVQAVESAATQIREEPEESDEKGSTLFLKNLSFSTTSERLATVLSSLPGFSFTRVQQKPDPKRPGQKLSMGYGFVGFKTREAAQNAFKGLQGFEVDGHALDVKFAQREGGAAEDSGKTSKEVVGKSKTTKMMVKNLPFEATRKEVKELFSAYGQLKSVRLPKKHDARSHGRGFAFLDFTTRREAETAMEALKHTHLLGRHLVLEWAEENSVDVDKLRLKVGQAYGKGEAVGGRKRKLDMGGMDVDDNDGMD